MGYAKVADQENPFAFFEYDDQTEEEIAKVGSFVNMNTEMKSWYLENKEAVHSNPISINHPGEGIVIPMKDEPLVRFRDSRTRAFLAK